MDRVNDVCAREKASSATNSAQMGLIGVVLRYGSERKEVKLAAGTFYEMVKLTFEAKWLVPLNTKANYSFYYLDSDRDTISVSC